MYYDSKEFPTKDYQKSYEDERDSINSKDFMIGALIGGMIGAATALFMAPKTGKELRNDFNEQARNISEKTERLRQTAMEKGTVLADTAKEKQAPSRKSFPINLRISSTK